MAWIEIHQELVRHPKTVKLLAALKWTAAQRAAAVGHLVCLWCWSVDFVEADGDMAELQALEIAAGAEWPGDPDAFVAALVKAGWLDLVHEANPLTGDGARYQIHNWEKYIGRLAEAREHDRQRKAISRARAKAARDVELTALQAELPGAAAEDRPTYGARPQSVRSDVQPDTTPDGRVTVTALSDASHPNRTVPNLTQPNQTNTTGPKAGPSGPGGVSQREETTANSNGNGGKAEGGKQKAEQPNTAANVGGADVEAGARKAVLNQEPGTRNQKPAQAAPDARNRDWDVFGYALRRGAFVPEQAARRLVAWGKGKNPHALREPFMFVVLGRLLDGCDKRDLGTLETGDPVAYAIGWSQNADQAKRERPASQRNMKRAVELLAAADAALAKNGTGHREWMDSLAAEIEAMAAGKKAGAV